MDDQKQSTFFGLYMRLIQQSVEAFIPTNEVVGVIPILRALFAHFGGYEDTVQEERLQNEVMSLQEIARIIGTIFGVKGQSYIDDIKEKTMRKLKNHKMFQQDVAKSAKYLPRFIKNLKRRRIVSLEPMVSKYPYPRKLTKRTATTTNKSTNIRYKSTH